VREAPENQVSQINGVTEEFDNIKDVGEEGNQPETNSRLQNDSSGKK
jgi:hypothetical protein